MAILVDENTRMLIQGITGRFGQGVARRMLEVGSKVAAGVTPGRAGQSVWGIPVFNSVREALDAVGPVDAAVAVVPGPEAKGAVIESFEAGIKTVLMRVERVPLHDTLEIISLAEKHNIRLIGPGSAGVVSPGKASFGGLGGFIGSSDLPRIAFKPGRIGVISRSGGQTSTISWVVCNAGFGISTAVHLGSEPVLGTTLAELLPLYQQDEDSDGVVYFGEIGTVMEEEAAEIIREGGYSKPLVAYIAGKGLPSGLRFSHASAIVEGGRGTAEAKIKALKEVGAHVVDRPEDLGPTIKKVFTE
ncbi:MAG: succinate--CoA ligase subunit alpha [Deltaproteobacteria bacterium]|mgnify:CR=1 FL=1|nr:MAG: succinate--CoA ligase subunit alpha [Deltaproteobacteria bacterium]